MNSIKEYMIGFFSRSGSYVFFSTILSRCLSFLGSWMALQLLDDTELGVILFAFSIIQFVIPIGGFGLHQSLLRFGALTNSQQHKEELFNYVLKKGIKASFMIILVIIGIGYFIRFQFEKTYFYFTILSFAVLTFFLLEVVKSQFRLQHDNKSFAIIELSYNIILVVFIILFSFMWDGIGYSLALVLSPFLAALLFVRKLNLNLSSKKNVHFNVRSFWKYGLFGGLSNVATQLLLLIDLILVGHLLHESLAVTKYRYISIIPLSLLFLPRVFITTDFVTLTEKIKDQKYIYMYIKNYMFFFSLLSTGMLFIGYLFKKQILSVFGEEYDLHSDSFFVLIIGVTGIYILRGLFGNLLSSIGKIEFNYYIIVIAIVINIISNYYLIPVYGIKGAAITSAALMWFTGILSWLVFTYFYRKLSIDETKNLG